MKRTVAVVLLVAMLLAVVAGAGYAAAAAISIGGVDKLLGDSSDTTITVNPTPTLSTCTMVGINCTVQ